jgi:hypothetical protein
LKIKVSYSELVSGPGFNNRQAKAELEVTVEGKATLDDAYRNVWDIVTSEVKNQLQRTEPDIPF